jgi:hypothetical protein
MFVEGFLLAQAGEFADEAGDFHQVDGGGPGGENVFGNFRVDPGLPLAPAARAGEVVRGNESDEEPGFGNALIKNAVLPVIQAEDALGIEKIGQRPPRGKRRIFGEEFLQKLRDPAADIVVMLIVIVGVRDKEIKLVGVAHGGEG